MGDSPVVPVYSLVFGGAVFPGVGRDAGCIHERSYQPDRLGPPRSHSPTRPSAVLVGPDA